MIKESDAQAFIAHFPDFYGPNAENTLLHVTLEKVVANLSSMFVGDQRIAREFIYTPDGAKAIVELAFREDAYGESWNIPGHSVITGRDIMETLRELTSYDKRVLTSHKVNDTCARAINPMMREVVEMYYLNQEPVVLNGEKI